MRPLLGDGRPRPADFDSAQSTTSGASGHMSFVIADESSLDTYLDQQASTYADCDRHSRFKNPRKSAGFGSGLPSATEAALSDDDDEQEDSDEDTGNAKQPGSDTMTVPLSPTSYAHSPLSLRSQTQVSSLSRPITPMMLGTSYAGSAMSTPSSRRNSFSGSISENALSLDEEDDMHCVNQVESLPLANSGSAPQLVMPSIKMPSRRPFTSNGKQLGRCKLLLAGNSRVGKTSLIKSIVQTCEHIVHVDPIAPQTGGLGRTADGASSSRRSSDSTTEIAEIYASTKPYPEWWSDIGASRSSQRRKSMGDSILERNICFVDTPGYASGSSAMETIVPCVDYIESHLNKVSADALSDSDMLNMLGGSGGFQVDAVLYLISKDVTPTDLEFIRRLAPLTNIIPLLARADTLSAVEVSASKSRISGRLREAGIDCFSFSLAGSQRSSRKSPVIPFAVSSATGSDHDIMDASLLMSPDYVQPLISTDLTYLLEQVFSPDGSSWLRHAAVKKYLQWRESNPSKPKHLYRPLSPPQADPSLALVKVSHHTAALGYPSVAHAPGQNHLASDAPQFKVVDWATDLQRSLASEQACYEKLAGGERAVWLSEKVHECIQEGTLVPIGAIKDANEPRRKRTSRHGSTRTKRHQDPLGLLQVTADMKARGWVALEFLGGLSVVGGLAIWLTTRHSGQWHTDPLAMANDWAKVWGLDL